MAAGLHAVFEDDDGFIRSFTMLSKARAWLWRNLCFPSRDKSKYFSLNWDSQLIFDLVKLEIKIACFQRNLCFSTRHLYLEAKLLSWIEIVSRFSISLKLKIENSWLFTLSYRFGSTYNELKTNVMCAWNRLNATSQHQLLRIPPPIG